MSTKVSISRDTSIVIVLVFLTSFGFNLFQRFQYADLLQEHTDLEWSAQDTGINLVHTRGLLKQCKAETAQEQAFVEGLHRHEPMEQVSDLDFWEFQ
ncbi:MAG: hypothetical protein OEU36_10265 [Gammaproteobacteria bacterium]|nr:hypothetical protein [Gammaproteobacteria bacterium]